MITTTFVSIGLFAAWRSLLLHRRDVAGTTLRSAWAWAVAAAVVWTLTWVLDRYAILSKSMTDHLWYASSVVALCPLIAVLGSRRPGSRVWTAFIQIPMLFVLGWPVITLVMQGQEIRGLQLESPQLYAFLLVLLMGSGNYLGTRYTVSSLCYAMAVGCIAASNCIIAPAFVADRESTRVWSTGLISLALILLPCSTTQGSAETNRFDCLWLDFFHQFGVVWGRRIQDRINHVASKENWPGRLELHGFEWTSPPDIATASRVEHTFRWLLRRFVDPTWIDERLGTPLNSIPLETMPIDS